MEPQFITDDNQIEVEGITDADGLKLCFFSLSGSQLTLHASNIVEQNTDVTQMQWLQSGYNQFTH